MQLLQEFFSSRLFMPHGHCYLWRPELVWLQVLSNALIGLAYLSISSTLYYIIRRIRDLPFQWMYLCFGVFIITCGFTHFMDVVTVWHSYYWLDGGIRAVTAVASVGTTILLVPLVPKARALADAAQMAHERGVKLQAANQELGRLLDRTRELESLKTQFFQNVSHELRTPLTLMLGPLQRMLDADRLDPAQRADLELMQRSGALLLKHVNDLLDVSRMEAGRLAPSYASADLARLLRLCTDQFASTARGGVDLTVEAPPSLPAQLDPDQISRVLMNLLSNAFKFTPRGGRIRCTLRLEEDAAVLQVADSGPGIPEAQREAVFERFRQLDGGMTRRHGGTGLGLAIARDLVSLHRGTLTAGQAPPERGGGALFTLRLPLHAPPGTVLRELSGAQPLPQASIELAELAEVAAAAPVLPAPAVPAVIEGQAARPRVLVVEDHPDMNRFLCEILGADYAVAAAFDGAEGHEAARAAPPDLIVSDLMMPRVSGEELLARVRADEALRDVPILLLSARGDEPLRVRLLRSGAQDYLVKPFSPQELRARAGNLISVHRATGVLQRALRDQRRDLVALAAEVAARKEEAEAALEVARLMQARAEQASQTKSNFLNLVTHELRTPLTGLKLQLDMLGRGRDAAAPVAGEGRLQQRIARMREASLRLSELVDSVLEYSRIESGRLRVERSEVDLPALCREVVEELRGLAEHKGLTLLVREPEAPPPPVRSDARLLRLILSNLIGNAVKFTERGQIEVLPGSGPGHGQVAVRDTGPGIPEEQRGVIFEPFTHIEPVNQKHTPGAGLGLALVRQLVQALGGQVEVASEMGAGSTFTVCIPDLPPAQDVAS